MSLTKSAFAPIFMIASLVFSGHTFASETEQHEFDIASGGELNLITEIGSVKVDTHNQDRVLVEIEKTGYYEERFTFVSDQSGNKLTLKGDVDGKRHWSRGDKVKIRLTVPEQFDLMLKTEGGSISIADLRGDIDARTAGGSISLGDVEGNIEVDTSGGSISVESVKGNLNAHTSGGSIRAKFVDPLTEDAVLETSGGSIDVSLPEDSQFDLRASTSGGRVTTDFNVSGRIKRQSIKGTVNGGGPRLTLHTSGGSVAIRSR